MPSSYSFGVALTESFRRILSQLCNATVSTRVCYAELPWLDCAFDGWPAIRLCTSYIAGTSSSSTPAYIYRHSKQVSVATSRPFYLGQPPPLLPPNAIRYFLSLLSGILVSATHTTREEAQDPSTDITLLHLISDAPLRSASFRTSASGNLLCP
jgi:hypothetical protein